MDSCDFTWTSYGHMFALVKQRALVQKREEGFPNSSQPLSPCFVLETADFIRRDDATTGFSNYFPMQIPTYISCILVVYCRVFWAVFSNTNLFSVTPRPRELLAELSIKFLRVCTRCQDTKKDHRIKR